MAATLFRWRRHLTHYATEASAAVATAPSTVAVAATVSGSMTFALVATGLAAAALLACYVPARRALAINPIVAPRTE